MWKGKCGRKRCTSSRDDRSLEKIVRKGPFKNVGDFHKEWTEAGVSASRATTHRRILHMGFKCLYGDADFIFQQDLAPAHTAKSTKT